MPPNTRLLQTGQEAVGRKAEQRQFAEPRPDAAIGAGSQIVAIARFDPMLVQLHAMALGRGLAQEQRGA